MPNNPPSTSHVHAQRSDLPTPFSNEHLLDVLYRHFNVSPANPIPGAHLLESIQLSVTRDSHLPTHVLALLDSTTISPDFTPILVPLRAGSASHVFANLLLPRVNPRPTPHALPSRELVITLPVVPIVIPHPSTMPLLLLFALKLERQPNLLAYNLLPPLVIAEFPHAVTMAQVLATHFTDDQFNCCLGRNQGLWKNVLALGYQDPTMVAMIQTVWNVTAEARRIRQST